MLMRIGMVQGQPGGGEGGELRFDLGAQFPPRGGREEIAHAQRGLIRGKPPIRPGDVRQALMAQERIPIHQHQMQPDIQARQRLRPRHRIRRPRRRHHQAGLRQPPQPAALLHRLIHGFSQAEIIGRENQLAQLSFRGVQGMRAKLMPSSASASASSSVLSP